MKLFAIKICIEKSKKKHCQRIVITFNSNLQTVFNSLFLYIYLFGLWSL